MAENILGQGISLYRQKSYTGALSFFLSLPVDCGADKNEIAYYLGLCYAKLQRYDDALLYLEQVLRVHILKEPCSAAFCWPLFMHFPVAAALPILN